MGNCALPGAVTLQYIYDTGRRDEAHWVGMQQLAKPERISAALQATTVGSW